MDIKSLPVEFLNNMREMLGENYGEYISYMETAKPRRGLRVNTLKTDIDEFEKIFPFELSKSPFSDDGYYLPAEGAYGSHPYHHAGLYYMQEPSAMSVVSLIKPYIGKRVLDMCAAPGGKSSYLAGLMQNDGILFLNEYVFSRAKILVGNMERMGVRNAFITNNSPKDIARLYPSFFDTVIVDAPCSGEGMFVKEESAITSWNAKNVATSAERQFAILNSAYEVLSPYGYMVYSTCTLNKIENEGVIKRFLKAYPDMKIVEPHSELKNNVLSGFDGLENAIRIFPHKHIGEGHFACLMQKTGGRDMNIKFSDTYTHIKADNECRELYSSLTGELPPDRFFEHNSRLYDIGFEVPYVKGINLVKCGVTFAERANKRIVPHHNIATIAKRNTPRNSISFPAESIEIKKYLVGETLNVSADFKGYGVIEADGYPLGIIKSSDGAIKNHYPKGLRNVTGK